MTIYTTPPEPDANKPVTPASGVGPPVGGSGSTAERFVSQELIQAKKSLQAVRIGGTLFLVFVGGYLYYLTSTFVANMRPHDAAEIAFGIVNQQVEDKGPDLVSHRTDPGLCAAAASEIPDDTRRPRRSQPR